MLLALYNADGSIKKINLTEIVTQGSNGVNELFISIKDLVVANYSATANFTLPDGSVTTLLGEIETKEINDVEYSGFSFVLSANETKYSGIVFVSIQITNNSTLALLRTACFPITINKTNADIDETLITLAQYNALVSWVTSLDIGADGNVEVLDLGANNSGILASLPTPNVILKRKGTTYDDYFIYGRESDNYVYYYSARGMYAATNGENVYFYEDAIKINKSDLTWVYQTTSYSTYNPTTINNKVATKTAIYKHYISGFVNASLKPYFIIGYSYSNTKITNDSTIFDLRNLFNCEVFSHISSSTPSVDFDKKFDGNFIQVGSPVLGFGTVKVYYIDDNGAIQNVSFSAGSNTLNDVVTQM